MENENESINKPADGSDIENKKYNKFSDNGNMNKPIENVKEKYLFIKKKKKNSKVLIILGVVLFFTIAIAGAYFLSINETPEKSPQEIIKSSLEKMSNLKTYQVDGNVIFNGSMTDSESKNQSAKINISLNGKNDASNPENSKAHYNMKAVADLKNEWGSEEYSADFEEMVFGQESVYFRINDYNLGMEMGTILGPQIEPYKGRWYFLSAEEARKFSENFGAMSPTSMEAMGAFDENKIMDIISKYEVLKFDKDLGDEKLGGIDVYHYKAKLDGMAVAYMYLDIMKEVVSGYGEGAITSEEFKAELVKLKKEIEENYRDLINEGFQKAEIEMWIGKEDGYVYRVVVKGEMDEKYINKVMGATLGSAKARAMDASIKADVSGLMINLEMYYDDNNGSYENFTLPEYSDLKPENIRSSKDAYVIWANLNSTTDKWCLDSRGESGYVLGEINDFECPEFISNVPLGEKKDYTNFESSSDANDIKVDLDFNMDLSYSNFNRPMDIEKPEDVENLLDVLAQDSDNDGLSDVMEIFYGTDKNNPDTDGDGYSDGEEVRNGYDPALPGDAKLKW